MRLHCKYAVESVQKLSIKKLCIEYYFPGDRTHGAQTTLPMLAAGDRICSDQNPVTLGKELCRCILYRTRIAFRACIELCPHSLDGFLNKPSTVLC